MRPRKEIEEMVKYRHEVEAGQYDGSMEIIEVLLDIRALLLEQRKIAKKLLKEKPQTIIGGETKILL